MVFVHWQSDCLSHAITRAPLTLAPLRRTVDRESGIHVVAQAEGHVRPEWTYNIDSASASDVPGVRTLPLPVHAYFRIV